MDPYRLPRTVLPTRYDLHLEPNLTTSSFTGDETITVNVREGTREVWLNAAELTISEAALLQGDGSRVRAEVLLDEATERCRLLFDEPVARGERRLWLAFRGTLTQPPP